MTQLERFFSKVLKTDGCWEWQSRIDRHGYGKFKSGGKTWISHRFLYTQLNGPLLPSQFCMHTCDNRKCVNPDHLKLGTHSQNMDDMVNKGRQKSLKGNEHPNSKLNEAQVHEIREQYLKSNPTYASVARKYEVTAPTIRDVVKRNCWKHI